MKTTLTKNFVLTAGPGITGHGHRQERGFAVLVVLILMLLMFGLVMQSGLVLRGLRQELRLLEKRQILKYQAPSPPTNASPAQATSAFILRNHGQNQAH